MRAARIRTNANHRNTGVNRFLVHTLARFIIVEIRIVQMAVRINKLHDACLAPRGSSV